MVASNIVFVVLFCIFSNNNLPSLGKLHDSACIMYFFFLLLFSFFFKKIVNETFYSADALAINHFSWPKGAIKVCFASEIGGCLGA